MKQIVIFLGVFIFLISCKEAINNTYDKDKIQKQILDLGRSVVWGLNETNTDTLIRDFWKSDSAMFLIDGMKIEGFNNIQSALEGIPDRRKKLDLDVHNEKVLVLSGNMAIHVVEFHEKVTHMNDSISTGQGIWSTFYKKMQGDWKIIMVHESHLIN